MGDKPPKLPRKTEVKLDEESGTGEICIPSFKPIRNVEEMIEASGVDLKKWRVGKQAQIRTWPMAIGEGKVLQAWYVKAQLELIPKWLTVEPIKFRKVHRRKPRPVPRGTEASMLVIPDAHIGYKRDSYGVLTPLHDRRCFDIVHQVLKLRQPDLIYITGDWLDLAELSKYAKTMADFDTLQAAVCEGHYQLEQIRRRAPDARIIFQEGNHDARIHNLVSQVAPALASVKPVGSKHPLLSLPTLMGFSKIKGIEYVGPYGQSVSLWSGLRGSHGEVHGRDALRKAVASSSCNVLFGHTHKAMIEWVPRWDDHGRRHTRWGATMGMFGHTDGRLPSARPDGHDDYHQAMLWLERDKRGTMHPQLVYIDDGVAVMDGKVLEGREDIKGLQAAFPRFRFGLS